MKKHKTGGSFLESTVIMMSATIIVKIIGALFTIPLTNIYGAEGNGTFTNAYEIYSMMFIISTAGLPVAISRMVSEAIARGRQREAAKIGRVALLFFAVLGAIFSAIMFFFARPFSQLIGNSSAYYSIVAISPTIFFVCIMSAIRGYYQGLSNMIPTAVSQVIEAVGKLVFGLVLAYVLMASGARLEIVVSGAISGVTIGTVLSTLYIVWLRARDIKRNPISADSDKRCRSGKSILRYMIVIAIPITISASAISLANTIDMFIIMNRLQDVGYNEAVSTVMYGAYSMARKLFTMPQTFIMGIGISIIPAISRAAVQSKFLRAKQLTESAFRITALLAFPSAVGLFVLAKPILDLLYFNKPEDVLMAAPLLQALSPSVIFIALMTITNAVLQANGREKAPVISMFIGGAVKLVVNYVTVGLVAFNIMGAPIGTFLCFGTVAVLNFMAIAKCGIRVNFVKSFAKPLVAALAMGVVAWLINTPLSGILGAKIGVLASVGFAGIFYLFMLIALRALPKEDILMLPKGEKIAKILKM